MLDLRSVDPTPHAVKQESGRYNRGTHNASVYAFDGFELDVEAAELRRGHERIELRAKCFDLLRFLIENPGKLLTKEVLLERVWPDAVVADATLSRTMTEIREALGDDVGSPRYIRTVARRGYKFVGAVEARDRERQHRVLLVLTYEGRDYPLAAGEYVIGRSPEASIPIYMRSISRRHARIVVDGQAAWIEDLGSKNGTLVNGRAVQGRVPLSPGDQVRLGDETLILWSATDVTTERRES
jgi:DNA-binding winged helix-turn-helix (wHTH) protein